MKIHSEILTKHVSDLAVDKGKHQINVIIRDDLLISLSEVGGLNGLHQRYELLNRQIIKERKKLIGICIIKINNFVLQSFKLGISLVRKLFKRQRHSRRKLARQSDIHRQDTVVEILYDIFLGQLLHSCGGLANTLNLACQHRVKHNILGLENDLILIILGNRCSLVTLVFLGISRILHGSSVDHGKACAEDLTVIAHVDNIVKLGKNLVHQKIDQNRNVKVKESSFLLRYNDIIDLDLVNVTRQLGKHMVQNGKISRIIKRLENRRKSAVCAKLIEDHHNVNGIHQGVAVDFIQKLLNVEDFFKISVCGHLTEKLLDAKRLEECCTVLIRNVRIDDRRIGQPGCFHNGINARCDNVAVCILILQQINQSIALSCGNVIDKNALIFQSVDLRLEFIKVHKRIISLIIQQLIVIENFIVNQYGKIQLLDDLFQIKDRKNVIDRQSTLGRIFSQQLIQDRVHVHNGLQFLGGHEGILSANHFVDLEYVRRIQGLYRNGRLLRSQHLLKTKSRLTRGRCIHDHFATNVLVHHVSILNESVHLVGIDRAIVKFDVRLELGERQDLVAIYLVKQRRNQHVNRFINFYAIGAYQGLIDRIVIKQCIHEIGINQIRIDQCLYRSIDLSVRNRDPAGNELTRADQGICVIFNGVNDDFSCDRYVNGVGIVLKIERDTVIQRIRQGLIIGILLRVDLSSYKCFQGSCVNHKVVGVKCLEQCTRSNQRCCAVERIHDQLDRLILLHAFFDIDLREINCTAVKQCFYQFALFVGGEIGKQIRHAYRVATELKVVDQYVQRNEIIGFIPVRQILHKNVTNSILVHVIRQLCKIIAGKVSNKSYKLFGIQIIKQRALVVYRLFLKQRTKRVVLYVIGQLRAVSLNEVGQSIQLDILGQIDSIFGIIDVLDQSGLVNIQIEQFFLVKVLDRQNVQKINDRRICRKHILPVDVLRKYRRIQLQDKGHQGCAMRLEQCLYVNVRDHLGKIDLLGFEIRRNDVLTAGKNKVRKVTDLLNLIHQLARVDLIHDIANVNVLHQSLETNLVYDLVNDRLQRRLREDLKKLLLREGILQTVEGYPGKQRFLVPGLDVGEEQLGIQRQHNVCIRGVRFGVCAGFGFYLREIFSKHTQRHYGQDRNNCQQHSYCSVESFHKNLRDFFAHEAQTYSGHNPHTFGVGCSKTDIHIIYNSTLFSACQ